MKILEQNELETSLRSVDLGSNESIVGSQADTEILLNEISSSNQKSFVWKYFKKIQATTVLKSNNAVVKDQHTYAQCKIHGCSKKYLFTGSTMR